MAIKDHHRSQQKERVQIFTVDPSTRRVEVILKDGAMIQVAVWETSAFFRWPEEGEFWTIYQEQGMWMLGSPMENEGTIFPVGELSQGEAKIDADVVKSRSGGTFALEPVIQAITTNGLMDYGTVTLTFTASLTSATATTPHDLGLTPITVILTAQRSPASKMILVNVLNLTANSFDVIGLNVTGSATTESVVCHWVALA